jgi:hypothetical protein
MDGSPWRKKRKNKLREAEGLSNEQERSSKIHKVPQYISYFPYYITFIKQRKLFFSFWGKKVYKYAKGSIIVYIPYIGFYIPASPWLSLAELNLPLIQSKNFLSKRH